ncbi:hypothetical protein UT300003_15000 [Clostridium sardiniense]
MIHSYSFFKSKEFIILSVFKKNTSLKSSSITTRFILTTNIFILGLISTFFTDNSTFKIILFFSLLSTSVTTNNILIISRSYISNLFSVVPISNLDYIIIEKPSYTSFKLVFHSRDNTKYKPIVLSNKNIDHIIATLREYGCEVHVSTTYK